MMLVVMSVKMRILHTWMMMKPEMVVVSMLESRSKHEVKFRACSHSAT